VHLAEYLAAPDERAAVVADACALIDQQVAGTSGVSGLAIRSAYRVVSGVRPGMVATAVDGLLVPFAEQLDPFYQEHVSTGIPLAQVLVAQRTSMAEALLSITDDRADRTTNRTVRRAYQRVRGSARQHVEAAAPGIAELVTAHAPGPDGARGR
jgi:Family of unknown function (DUF6918)